MISIGSVVIESFRQKSLTTLYYVELDNLKTVLVVSDSFLDRGQ